jgi:hypothetical protein
MLKRGRRIARDRGCHRITAYPEDETAHAFYESQGFQVVTRIGVFAKELAKFSKQPSGGSVQAIALGWDTRPHPPNGFRLVIGDNDTSYYAWTCLRQMSALYALLGSEAPRPNLWLLRQEEAEALTVDYDCVRLWFSSQGFATSDFQHAALRKTEQLSSTNGVLRLTAAAFSSQFPLLRAEGYTLQKEYPYLALSL